MATPNALAITAWMLGYKPGPRPPFETSEREGAITERALHAGG
jgi:hypothetical protein